MPHIASASEEKSGAGPQRLPTQGLDALRESLFSDDELNLLCQTLEAGKSSQCAGIIRAALSRPPAAGCHPRRACAAVAAAAALRAPGQFLCCNFHGFLFFSASASKLLAEAVAAAFAFLHIPLGAPIIEQICSHPPLPPETCDRHSDYILGRHISPGSRTPEQNAKIERARRQCLRSCAFEEFAASGASPEQIRAASLFLAFSCNADIVSGSHADFFDSAQTLRELCLSQTEAGNAALEWLHLLHEHGIAKPYSKNFLADMNVLYEKLSLERAAEGANASNPRPSL